MHPGYAGLSCPLDALDMMPIDPSHARIAVGLAIAALFAIRAPFRIRCLRVPVARRKLRELLDLPLTLAKVAMLLPILWVFTPLLGVADYPLPWVPFLCGILCFPPALWLFYRSHADLGTNWSTTLEVREGHRLVTRGIYQHIRHPMYLALVLFSLGLALSVPNYAAGPALAIAMVNLLGARIGPEEEMMCEEFGEEYEDYRQRSSRIFPGIW